MIWSLLVISSAVLLSFVDANYQTIQLKKIKVNIDQSNGHSFITKSQVLRTLSDIGIKADGKQQQYLDCNRIEKIIKGFSGTKNAEVFFYNSGELHVEIIQRTPIARVLHENGYLSYYIDQDGKVMALSNNYVARVPVFNGSIKYGNQFSPINKLVSNNQEDVLLKGIYNIANVINRDEFLSAQIVQIYCNDKGHFELIPRIGNHRVMFGAPENINEKFIKLKSFYTKGINIKELNLYDTLNIMYNDQIICSKR